MEENLTSLKSLKFTKLHRLTGTKHYVTNNDLVSSGAADRVGRCCRLPVARASWLPLLPMVPRADWLVARRYGVEAQTYVRA